MEGSRRSGLHTVNERKRYVGYRLESLLVEEAEPKRVDRYRRPVVS